MRVLFPDSDTILCCKVTCEFGNLVCDSLVQVHYKIVASFRNEQYYLHDKKGAVMLCMNSKRVPCSGHFSLYAKYWQVKFKRSDDVIVGWN